MNENSNDTFYCSFVSIHYIICECGKTFPSQDDLKDHLKKQHPHKRERKEFQCGVCEAVFNTERACINHYEESHGDCKEEPDSEDCYEESHNVKIEHDYDDQNLIEESEDFTEQSEEVYIFNTNDVKLEVVETHEAKDKKEKRKAYYKSVVCEVCGKAYASNAALRYHQRVHTGERPYKCPVCPKNFTMPLFLQIHIRTHTGERPFQCLDCPKAFSSKAALLRHERVHTGVKPYKCPKCGKAFTQSNSMKLHVSTVHLKMPAPYKSKSRRLKAKQRQMLREASKNDTEVAVQTTECNIDNEASEIKEEIEMYQQEIESEELYEEDLDGNGVTYQIVYTN